MTVTLTKTLTIAVPIAEKSTGFEIICSRVLISVIAIVEHLHTCLSNTCSDSDTHSRGSSIVRGQGDVDTNTILSNILLTSNMIEKDPPHPVIAV